MSHTECSDWTTLALAGDGRSLVEASAGTGKTWTIAALYLRLLLEGEAPPRPTQIIVSTFTRAAAAELSGRLRARLLEAVSLAMSADPAAPAPADPVLAWLHGRWNGATATAQRERDALRLREALAELDRAPILTLHSLCQRVLTEFTFEVGSPLRADALVDSQALVDEVADDLWRWLHQGDPQALPDWLRGYTLERSTLRTWLRSALSAGVDLGSGEVPVLDVEAHARRIEPWRALLGLAEPGQPAPTRAWWKKTGAPGLNDALDALPVLLSGASPSLADVDVLAQGLEFDPTEAVRKTPKPPERIEHALASLAPLAADLRRFVNAARCWLLLQGRQRLERLLDARQQSTFDALVERVHAVLAGPDPACARRLADALYAAWPVALVDEFQDTDGLQYGILDRIYRDEAGVPRGRLLMIGDPKQAIYRFRGGDIGAYLRARAEVLASGGQRLSLAVNHRSSWHYVEALNALYSACGWAMDAAGFDPDDRRPPADRIVYEPVHSAAKADGPGLFEVLPDGRRQRVEQPLVLHRGENRKGMRGRALRICADQIAALLAESRSGRWRIGDGDGTASRAVEAGDIAVLLPSNADIQRLQAMLAARGVPCVASRRSSVLQAAIARELLLVLEAAHAPGRLPLLRAALMTAFWSLDSQAIDGLGDELSAWNEHLKRFAVYQSLWRTRGVLGLVLQLAADCAPSLRAAGYGDRDLADLRHLGELLGAQSATQPGPEALLDWLAREIAGDGDAEQVASDDRQLRLDSEAARVQLMTLHASKGLEFPLVWLPTLFLLKPRAGSKDELLLLRPEGDSDRRVPGFGAAAAELAQREALDECYRLIYVALTRARLGCHLFTTVDTDADAAAAPAKPARSAAKPAADKHTPLQRMLARVLPSEDGSSPLAWRAAWTGAPAQAAAAAEPQPTAAPLAARPLPPVRPPRFLHSFTQLTRQAGRGLVQAEAAADDESEALPLPPATDAPAVPEPAHPDLEALAAWRGAEFGNALHAIYEERDPARALPEQLDLVLDCLARHRIRPAPGQSPEAFARLLATRLQGALEAPLGLAADPGLSLATLAARQQRAEMAFDFVVDQRPLDALRHALEAHGLPALAAGREGTLNGLFTGKIDLLFEHQGRVHVLDYKGNWLGPALADYRGAALQAKMDAAHYRLQALLYAVATRRYLRQRLGADWHEDRLGECVYLFVRAAGLDPQAAPDAGIWRQRFDPALLDAVDAALAGPSKQESR